MVNIKKNLGNKGVNLLKFSEILCRKKASPGGMDGQMAGSKSWFKDCLQQLKWPKMA